MGCPANGSRHSMALVAETEAGTTPATPDFTPIRQTGTTLALTKEALQSNELRADRQIADMRHGNKQVGGDISTELSYGGSLCETVPFDLTELIPKLSGNKTATGGG